MASRLEHQLTKRPNRDSDCDRMRLYYRWQRFKNKHPQLKEINNDEYRLCVYNQFWTSYGASMSSKSPDEIKAYIIVKITEEITPPQLQERARRYIIENADDTISWSFFESYINTKHRTCNSATRNINVLSKRRRVYNSKKKPSTVIQPISTKLSISTESISLTIPVLFGPRVLYSSFMSMLEEGNRISTSSSLPSV